jgi:DHA1 family bicyclomycin/chloramphenicol resistance-like MFS transporter
VDRRVELKCLFLIVVVLISACVETDIYLPAFPDMMTAFSASEGAIQGLLTWNFVGICVSGPLYGPISDSFGRKKPLMVALGIFLLGSIMALFAKTLDQMLWGRILQGLGSGGCFTLGTAILFDAFQKDKAIDALTKLNMIIPVIMSVAPMVGGYLNYTYGFRSNFLVIAIFVLVSFAIALFFFDETHAPEKRAPFQARAILRDFKQVFSNLAFWQITLVISLSFAGYIAFLSGTAVLFVVDFGMSKAVFPFVQAAILGAWVVAGLVINRAIARWGALNVKKAGTALAVVGILMIGLVAWIAPQNPYLLTCGMLLDAFGANWMIGLYFPEAMELLPHIKGVTASLATSARLLIAALIVGLTSALYDATIYPLAAVMVGTIVVILPTLIFYEKRRAKITPLA